MRLTIPILLLTLASPAYAASPTGPEARTKALVETFLAVTVPAPGKTLDASTRLANAASFAKLDRLFDWETISAATLAAHKSALTTAQINELKTVFQSTVRWVSYPSSGDFFRSARWRVDKVAGANVTLHAYLEEEDIETYITFHWRRAGDGWRIVDVSFDGASLVHDYQNQFGRIITKHGGNGLIERLEKRRASEAAAGKNLLP